MQLPNDISNVKSIMSQQQRIPLKPKTLSQMDADSTKGSSNTF